VTCPHCAAPLAEGSRFCSSCGADISDPGGGPRSTGSAELLSRLKVAVGDRYDIRSQLGRGGMGAVYLAVDRRLDRDVAIKVLPPEMAHDEQFVRRFEQEARTAAKLDHSGIIPIYAVEGERDLHYFVMKYVSGRSLESIVAAGPLPVDLVQRILWEAACALGHAHQRGVVHRDVKPANVMLDESGRVLLTDFGISKALRSASSFTATGQVIGTPHYMSPEQAKGGEIGGASDQYSLAVVGYRMLAGRLPFEEDSVHTVIYKHVWEHPPNVRSFRPDAPEFLAAAIHRAMDKDPAQRFPTMEALATAVWPENPVEAKPGSGAHLFTRRSVGSTDAPTEVSQPTAGRVAQPPRPPRRRWPMAVASALVVLGGGAAALALTPPGRALLRQAGLAPGTSTTAATPDTAAGDTGAVAQVPPTVLDTARGDTARPEPARDTVRRPADPPRRPVEAPAQPPATVPEAPRFGTLAIRSTPDGAVYIDGVERGESPGQWELAPGRHIVEVRRVGWITWVDTIQITAGNPLRTSPVLRREGQ
jgi:serine/threonine-protein kinase